MKINSWIWELFFGDKNNLRTTCWLELPTGQKCWRVVCTDVCIDVVVCAVFNASTDALMSLIMEDAQGIKRFIGTFITSRLTNMGTESVLLLSVSSLNSFLDNRNTCYLELGAERMRAFIAHYSYLVQCHCSWLEFV